MQIRQLDWSGYGDNLDATALGFETFYRVSGAPGNWTLKSPGKTGYVDTPGYNTQAAAKAAAQVDFERRISLEIRHD